MKNNFNFNNKREFLLSFFDENSGYAEKCINEYWLIKQFETRLKMWFVAIYKPEAYRKRKDRQIRLRGNCGERSKIN